MRAPVLWLCLLNFAFIGMLPRIFFRRGALNARWWATAAPFFVMSAVLAAALPGYDMPTANTWHALSWPLAVLAATASIALIGCTIGVHRVPLALWHQASDNSTTLVTHGPYARVRHPFYAAFLLALFGGVAAAPSVVSAAIALVGAVQLWRTAVTEERRLLASPLSAQYAVYMSYTGRFLPRLVRPRALITQLYDAAAINPDLAFVRSPRARRVLRRPASGKYY